TTAQTVTLAPACFTTVRKFCRRVTRETSAQVGRVATRLMISTVLATGLDYSGSGARAQVTLGLLLCEVQFPVSSFLSGALETGNPKLETGQSIPRQREVHRDLGFHFDGLVIENVGPVAALADGGDRR